MDAATQMWFMNKQSTNMKLKTWFLAWKNVKTLTHSQQQQLQGPKNSQIEVNNQIDNQNQCSVPPKGPFFIGSWSCLKSSARHTLSNKTVDNNHLKCSF